MEISFIGHASLLVRSGGVSILSDPWWRGPCFGAQWWPYPAPQTQLLDGAAPDYIYISHGHHDHFHPGTLASLPKTATVLVSSKTDLAAAVRELGFTVISVEPDEAVTLGHQGLRCRIIPTHGDDTLMALDDGTEVCLNLNDALHSAPQAVQDDFVAQLHALYPKLDYVFCGYGVASHFPNCYQIPGKDAVATAGQRQQHFNRQWSRLIAGLRPRFGFPFAADVVFLQDELFWVNEATHNRERPTDVFTHEHPQSRTEVLDIAPGFTIDSGVVSRSLLRRPIDAAALREQLGDEIARANRIGLASTAMADEVLALLQANLEQCRDHLISFDGDYRIALRFLNSDRCLLLTKSRRKLSLQLRPAEDVQAPDLTYTTRWAYLRWALQRPFGHEILFVGSGGIFDYPSAAAAKRDLHQELIHLIRNKPLPARSAGANKQALVYKLKSLVKALLGRRQLDLYDLMTWTVFDRQRH